MQTATSGTGSSGPKRSANSRAWRWALVAGIVAACLVAAFALDRAHAGGGGHSPVSGASLAFAGGAGGTRWQQGGDGGEALTRRLSASGFSIAAGTVQSVAGSSFTLQTLRGASVTVTVGASTIDRERGTSTASLADVSAGCRILVLGRKAAGGGLTASRVPILPAGAGGGLSG